MNVTIPDALAGERVDRVVAMLTGLTRADVAALVTRGDVRVNGVAVKTRSRKVAAGETLDVEVSAPSAPVLIADAEVPFTVIEADDEIIVVDKPAGVVVHPGSGVHAATLVNGLLARFPDMGAETWPDPSRPGIVHRLDKHTSGLLVVARTAAAAASLIAQMQARSVDRRYLALAMGELAHDAGTIDAPVGRASRDRTRMTIAADGREARTHYTVIQRFPESRCTLLECKLDTGRTHQIRVHLAAIGHPVAGDSRYRGGTVFGLHRPFLHAYKLAFDHPRTGARVAFSSSLPPDLDEVKKAAEGLH